MNRARSEGGDEDAGYLLGGFEIAPISRNIGVGTGRSRSAPDSIARLIGSVGQ